MEGNDRGNKLFFMDSFHEGDFARLESDRVLHILCTVGSMSFIFQEVRYNVVAGDYVILPNASLASGFSESADFKGIIMVLSEAFVTSMAIRSNYGIIGHLSLLQNPVMKLSAEEFHRCQKDLEYLRERLADTGHLFREELLGYLLLAHILDLYDIHARQQHDWQVSERAAILIRRFIEMLYQGDYVQHRNLDYYASSLCITPHYLSEICRKVSGNSASYWIDRFTVQNIIRLLRQKETPLKEIVEALNFSSFSYFSRYVQKHLGVSPSAYRQNCSSK